MTTGRWTSEFVLDQSMVLTVAPAPLPTIEAAVIAALEAAGWRRDDNARVALELGADAAGCVRIRMASSSGARVVAVTVSKHVDRAILIQARCDGFRKPVVELKRFVAINGMLEPEPFPGDPTTGLRGRFGDKFNEVYDAIDDRVERLLMAGITACGHEPTLAFTRSIGMIEAPRGSTPRIQSLVERARGAREFRLELAMDRMALVIIAIDGSKQTSFVTDEELAELKTLLA